MMRTVTVTLPGGVVVQVPCQIHELSEVIKQVNKSVPERSPMIATADLISGFLTGMAPKPDGKAAEST